MFDAGALFAAACESGLEGVIAKRRSAPYRPGERGWIEVKNRAYWRYGEEIESLRKSVQQDPLASGGRPEPSEGERATGDRSERWDFCAPAS